jgi:lactate dehydrogenase-like 2-hydroxyacid dehydrogenase
MSRPRVLVARRIPPAVAERAINEFDALLAETDMDADAVVRTAADHQSQGVLIGPKARLTAGSIAALPDSVRIIANPSVGVDHMDVEAARVHGLVVTNAPDVLTDCTADLAFMLILAACRRASEYNAVMREGWRKPFGMPDLLGVRASGRTLGIVGMGRIGQAVANMPRGAVFVNTARGSLVDEDAMIDALQSGQLFAAGLDVYRREPDFDLRLSALPNVFLTPHVASATVQTRDAMGFLALDNIAAVLTGRPPITPV